MIKAYFGLMGCGKTTLLARIATCELKKISRKKGKYKYKYVCSNVPLNIPGVRYMPFDKFGIVSLKDTLYLCDESSIYLDSRDFKNRTRQQLDYLALHRHENADIIFFLQTVNGYDKRFRSLTSELYLIRKSLIPFFSYYLKIPYGIVFPQGESLGDISEGYRQPNFLEKIFNRRYFFRPLYYHKFDTHYMPMSLTTYEDYILNS